ncbi:MAG: OmpW/AlkL family protein [Limnohabitans sp.]|jgi:outer membrane protein
MKKTILALSCLAAIGSAVHAQPAGTWLIQGGLTRIAPDVSSGTLSAPSPTGTQVDVGADTRLTAQLTYVYNQHWAVAVPLGTGFRHKLYGAGAIAGTGQVGTVSALPISVFSQYRFGAADAKVRPYAMLGLSYARFHDAQGSAALNGLNPANPVGGSTGLSVDSRWALSPGLGLSVQLDDKWFLDLSWARTYLKTTTTLSTGQTIQTTLNPSTTMLGLGMRF